MMNGGEEEEYIFFRSKERGRLVRVFVRKSMEVALEPWTERTIVLVDFNVFFWTLYRKLYAGERMYRRSAGIFPEFRW